MDGNDESETETGETDTAVEDTDGSLTSEQEGTPQSRGTDGNNESAEYPT